MEIKEKQSHSGEDGVTATSQVKPPNGKQPVSFPICLIHSGLCVSGEQQTPPSEQNCLKEGYES